MTLLDLCSYLGLGAAGTATLNLWLGLLIALRYSPVQRWPHRRINLFALHQWTAWLTVALVLTHPAVLLWLKSPRFGLFDLLWPIHSPLQPWINLTGAIAIYLVLLLVVTSLLRQRLGRPLWKRLHLLAFPTLILTFIHSLFTDPLLKDGHPDMLDGGKVFLEIACLLSAVAVLARIRLRANGLRSTASVRTSTPRHV